MRHLVVPVLLVPTLACTARTTIETDPWHTEVALEATHKLGGCAVGDFDPNRPGPEIAAVGSTGEVYLVWRTTVENAEGEELTIWNHEVIATTTGELIQCVAGDVDANSPGDELLVFGMLGGMEDDGGPGAAYVVSNVDGDWKLESVLEDEALIHAGCIGDVDPSHPGNEIVLAGFTRQVFVMHRAETGWVADAVATLEGDGKNAVPFRGGAVIAGNDGRLVHVHRGGDGWKTTVLDEAPSGQARLGVRGERLVAARDDGVLALVQGTRSTEIFRIHDKLRGAVLAEMDPRHDGPEAATAGYDKEVTLLTRSGDDWIPRCLFTDTHRFHHLTSGELLADSPGPELVACGYSGRLVVAWYLPPDQN